MRGDRSSRRRPCCRVPRGWRRGLRCPGPLRGEGFPGTGRGPRCGGRLRGLGPYRRARRFGPCGPCRRGRGLGGRGPCGGLGSRGPGRWPGLLGPDSRRHRRRQGPWQVAGRRTGRGWPGFRFAAARCRPGRRLGKGRHRLGLRLGKGRHRLSRRPQARRHRLGRRSLPRRLRPGRQTRRGRPAGPGRRLGQRRRLPPGARRLRLEGPRRQRVQRRQRQVGRRRRSRAGRAVVLRDQHPHPDAAEEEHGGTACDPGGPPGWASVTIHALTVLCVTPGRPSRRPEGPPPAPVLPPVRVTRPVPRQPAFDCRVPAPQHRPPGRHRPGRQAPVSC